MFSPHPIRTIARRPGVGLGIEGSAILELTVLLPFLFGLSLGVFEFGNLIYRYHLITVGVRDGARYLAGMPWDGTTELQAKNIAVTGVTAGGTNRVTWWNVGDVVVTPVPVTNADPDTGVKLYRGGANITMVRMTTSVAYQPLGYLGYFGIAPITLTASHEERYFGIR